MAKLKSKKGGRESVATMTAVEAPMVSVPSKEPPLSEKDVLRITTKTALSIVIHVIERLAKDGEKATFTEDEQKLVGRALGWLYMTTAGTANDPVIVLHESDDEFIKEYKTKYFAKVGGKLRGGVAPAAFIMGLIALVLGTFTSKQIYILDVNRELVREEGLAAIRNSCPEHILQGIPPTVTTGWFGNVDPREVAALRSFESQTAYCNNVKAAVNTRIQDAEAAYANAWTKVPTTIGAVGSTIAIAAGTPVGTAIAVQTVATTILTGAMPTGAALESTVKGLNDIGFPAAAGAGPPPSAPLFTGTSTTSAVASPPAPAPGSRRTGGAKRKTKKVKKSKRRITRRAITFAY